MIKILLVENSLPEANMILDPIGEFSDEFEIDHAMNFKEAKTLFLERKPQIVIMDIQLVPSENENTNAKNGIDISEHFRAFNDFCLIYYTNYTRAFKNDPPTIKTNYMDWFDKSYIQEGEIIPRIRAAYQKYLTLKESIIIEAVPPVVLNVLNELGTEEICCSTSDILFIKNYHPDHKELRLYSKDGRISRVNALTLKDIEEKYKEHFIRISKFYLLGKAQLRNGVLRGNCFVFPIMKSIFPTLEETKQGFIIKNKEEFNLIWKSPIG